jgi:hypothetical protein
MCGQCETAEFVVSMSETSPRTEGPRGIETLTEDEATILKYVDAYKPRTLRLATPLKCFIPNYEPAIETTRPIRSFVSVSAKK